MIIPGFPADWSTLKKLIYLRSLKRRKIQQVQMTKRKTEQTKEN